MHTSTTDVPNQTQIHPRGSTHISHVLELGGAVAAQRVEVAGFGEELGFLGKGVQHLGMLRQVAALDPAGVIRVWAASARSPMARLNFTDARRASSSTTK